MLEDFRMNVFLAVAQEKSFTKAAALLGVSQPAVSQHVSELEKQLNVKLFERLHGETVLTGAGKVLKKYAEQINSDYRNVNMMFDSFPQTTVSVCASEDIFDYLISILLADFIVCHPEMTFVRTSEQDAADIVITLIPDDKRKRMFALNAHPSDDFAKSSLWLFLADLLK